MNHYYIYSLNRVCLQVLYICIQYHIYSVASQESLSLGTKNTVQNLGFRQTFLLHFKTKWKSDFFGSEQSRDFVYKDKDM